MKPNPKYDIKPISRFFDPCGIPEMWGVYCFVNFLTPKIDDDELELFTRRMISRGFFRDMAFTEPKVVETMLISDLKDLESFFDKLSTQNLELVFIGLPDCKLLFPIIA